MEYSLSSDKGIITTSSLSSSSRSGSPSSSSSSSPSTNYPPSPPAAVTSSLPLSSSSSSPISPPTDLPPIVTSSPSASSSVFPQVTVVVISSCAACKFLGQICAENCVLATCFPPDDPIKFTTVHRVFGAGNIIKLLQELPESQRADAVSSMVYEANARLRDPVYGCVGSICLLQKQVSDLQAQLGKAQAETVHMQCQQANLVSDLQAQLAKAQAEVVNVQCQEATLVSHLQAQLVKAQAEVLNMRHQLDGLIALFCMEMSQSSQESASQQSLDNFANILTSFLDDNVNDFGSLWEPLWT